MYSSSAGFQAETSSRLDHGSFLIPFIGINSPWVDSYVDHLQKYTEDTATINIVATIIMTIISPFIFYRPMMAWIGSLIGRSGLLSTAFARTKGNYWQFMTITVVFSLLSLLVEVLDKALSMRSWLIIFLDSAIVVFLNVVIAKTYEYFFLEIEK